MSNSADEQIISGAADGSIYLTNTNYSTAVNSEHLFSCHGNKTCYEVRTFVHDPNLFVSCGQDGCCKWVDLRENSKCTSQFCDEHTLVKLASGGISALAVNPYVPYHIVLAGLDGVVRFYDRRMLSVGSTADQSAKALFACFSNCARTSSKTNKRITSLQYDNWGKQLLVSCQTSDIYLLDWRV